MDLLRHPDIVAALFLRIEETDLFPFQGALDEHRLAIDVGDPAAVVGKVFDHYPNRIGGQLRFSASSCH